MIEYKVNVENPLYNDNCNMIQFSIHYNKGYGYTIVCIPIKISKIENSNFSMKEFGAFIGFKERVLACNRKSAKNLNLVLEILENKKQSYIDSLINKINASNNTRNTG